MEALKYLTGFLRHVFWRLDNEHIEEIREQYINGQIDRRTAKRELHFVGVYPLPMGDIFLTIFKLEEAIEDLRKYLKTERELITTIVETQKE